MLAIRWADPSIEDMPTSSLEAEAASQEFVRLVSSARAFIRSKLGLNAAGAWRLVAGLALARAKQMAAGSSTFYFARSLSYKFFF